MNLGLCVHLSILLILAGTLLDIWASAEAVSLLTALTLADLPFQTGKLPNTWASNGSFPVLNSLTISLRALNGSSLSGPLPTAWGHPDAFRQLQNLQLGGPFTGTHSPTTHSPYLGSHWQIFRCCHGCSSCDHVLT